MDQDSLSGVRHVHLIGVGGVGVSALAPPLIQRGVHVTGSDPARNEATERLEALGVRIMHEHKPENVEGADLVVATSAARPDHPERRGAETRGIPVWPRARMLGALVNEKRPIVVTGAHGKTTLTAMLTQLLIDLDLDPSAYVGGELRAIGGNVRTGGGEWAIAEGDESDGSFTWLKPEIALINNIDADHLDHYPDIYAIVKAFEGFLQGVRENGTILCSADCELTRDLIIPAGRRRLTYGFNESADVRGSGYEAEGGGCRCLVTIGGETRGLLTLRVSGRHNTHNALGAIAVSETIGLPFDRAAAALGRFDGVQRRMEEKGRAAGVTVVDDYAHHPNEIKAAIQGLRDRYTGRLIGVFQPHLYSRTMKLRDEFGAAFNGLDLLVITGIYAAREAPVDGVSGEILLGPARRNGANAMYIPRLDEAAEFLTGQAHEGDVVVTFGAGDVWKLGMNLLERLSGKEAAR